MVEGLIGLQDFSQVLCPENKYEQNVVSRINMNPALEHRLATIFQRLAWQEVFGFCKGRLFPNLLQKRGITHRNVISRFTLS